MSSSADRRIMSPTRPNQTTIGCTGGADMTPHGCAGALSYAGRGCPGKGSSRSMRALSWFLGLMALALAAIAAFSWPAWLLLHPHFDFPFHRIGERIGMLVLLAGFLASGKDLRLYDCQSLRYRCPRRAVLRDMSIGVARGVLSMRAGVGIMSAPGQPQWSPFARPAAGALLRLALM